jgi:glucose/mannose transport system substrate-binding protein
MLPRLAAILACGLWLGPFSTSSSAAEPRPNPRSKLSVYHWWTSPSESAAINALAELFGKKYPDVAVSVAVSPREDMAMFHVVAGLLRAHQPPDSFQIGTGYSAQSFVDAGMLTPVDDIWKSEGLDKVVPPVIAEANRLDGHYYSIPIAVHRMNVVWCNKALLEKHKINPSTLTTWPAFFKAAEALRAGGVQAPIQLAEAWTVSDTFETIIASLGIATYEDFLNGKIRSADDPRLVEAFNLFDRYLGYVNEDHSGVAWDRAVRRVIKGEAAFVMIGDWANGEFKLAGMTYGKDYEAIAVPGTKGMYGINVDAFPHPQGLADDANSLRWLKLAASREGQDAFNPLKGSISARKDADVTRYDPYQRAAIADLKTASIYPSINLGAPPAFVVEFTQVVTTFATDRDTKNAVKALAEGTEKLAGRYKRVWSLK